MMPNKIILAITLLITVTVNRAVLALTAGEQLLNSQLEESDAVIKGKLLDFKIIPMAEIYQTDRKGVEEIQGFSWYELRVKPILGQTKKSKRSLSTKPIEVLILQVGIASAGNKKSLEFPMKNGEQVLLFLKNHSQKWSLENHMLDIYSLHESEEYFMVPKLLENSKSGRSSTGLTKSQFQMLMARYIENYSPSKMFGDSKNSLAKNLVLARGVASIEKEEEPSLVTLLENPSHLKKYDTEELNVGDIIPGSWEGQADGTSRDRRAPSSAKARYEQITGVASDQEHISIYFLLGLLGLLSVFGNIFVRFFFPEKD